MSNAALDRDEIDVIGVIEDHVDAYRIDLMETPPP
jgi:hypothetical protein